MLTLLAQPTRSVRRTSGFVQVAKCLPTGEYVPRERAFRASSREVRLAETTACNFLGPDFPEL